MTVKSYFVTVIALMSTLPCWSRTVWVHNSLGDSTEFNVMYVNRDATHLDQLQFVAISPY